MFYPFQVKAALSAEKDILDFSLHDLPQKNVVLFF